MKSKNLLIVLGIFVLVLIGFQIFNYDEFEISIDEDFLESIEDISKDASLVPEEIERGFEKVVKISLTAKEVSSEIEPGLFYDYWTYEETVPGPLLRVREGDTIELTLKNDESSKNPHSIDLHAVTGPGGGAVLTQVAPGESKTFKFKALNPGLFVYHCATPIVPEHIANGMYGMILVEPKEGLSKVDKEFYVVQGELYTVEENGEIEFDYSKVESETPNYVVFNGKK
ncbi:MAG: multicopper oxidase domain-containing protein, partial [Candidatus Nanoarchaeia archaeon]|nr:multicopper oxidase domain-containing protein [Candidatus Nanoarchaeia archaeon]